MGHLLQLKEQDQWWRPEWLKSFVQQKVIPYEIEDLESQEVNFDHIRELSALGFFKCIAPLEFKGFDASVDELIQVVRELSYGSASLGTTFIGNLLGMSAMVMYGSRELQAKTLAAPCEEAELWSFAMSEAGVGSDLKNTKTVARQTKDGFVLSGEKNFITNANHSKHVAVFAQLLDEKDVPKGVSCFYVPGNTPGLIRGPSMNKIAWKKANTGTLIFENLKLPHHHLLGKPGQGLKILTHCLNRSKTLLGAMGVGISYRALDLAVERLNSTIRYERPLLDQGVIRHKLARHHMNVEAAWLLTQRAAQTWDKNQPAVKEASMAKLFSGHTAATVCLDMQELFGARGLFNDYEISKLHRDAKAIEIVEGPSLVQELLIAREVLPQRASQKSQSQEFRIKADDLKKAV